MDTNRIQKNIEEFLTLATFPPKEISLEEHTETKDLWVSTMIDNAGLLVGPGSEGFLAINHLINKMIEKETGEGELVRVTIDINGYQKKRVENIKTIAHMMAERARFFKSSVELDPMSAYERRIVHEFLANTKDVLTESTGEGRDRRVVIRFAEQTSI